MKRAFSLIELLVAVGVIGILIALSVPALRGVRADSLKTVSLSNVRSILVLFDMYADRYKGQYPVIWEGKQYPMPCPNMSAGAYRWETLYRWPAVIHEFMDWEHGRAIFLAPRARRESESLGNVTATGCGDPPSYDYSQTFFARPEIWAPRTEGNFPALDPKWLSPTYQSDVLHPSRKVILWDWEMPYLSRPRKMAGIDLAEPTAVQFTDGHGEFRAPAAATPPVRSDFAGTRRPVQRLHNTENGVRGIDF
ncbi:MAG: type II secretion system protein [Phycisphaerales bacterium]